MTEEAITKRLLRFLIDNQWEIICFDYPQSGTGRIIHPNNSSDKNKHAIIPDIVAVRNSECLFFENKDRFYYSDFVKQHNLKCDNQYTEGIALLLKNHVVNSISYGIGMPLDCYSKAAKEASALVDFVVCISDNGDVSEEYKVNPGLSMTMP